MAATTLKEMCKGLPLKKLPDPRPRDSSVPHAPTRTPGLNAEEKELALKNALRYFPAKFHEELAKEFSEELEEFGHIYMYRFRPALKMKAYPIEEYPTQCKQSAAIIHMIMNNLDPQVAQFPHELVTYGGNGQVFSNWAQFLLTVHYLSKMTDNQTLVMYSGHPMGLFPSNPAAPRLVITNGMMIPNYSSKSLYEKLFSLGVTMYGQMTAGSYCYIGPQGIVHGTTLTVLNASRKYLKSGSLLGKVFVTSGLGGMSGAQAKAAVIAGCVGVVAEISYEESLEMMYKNPEKFRYLVQETLRRHVKALNGLAKHGMFFWDYGNAFLLEADRAGADVGKVESMNGTKFRYPSYVQDIMGDIFSLGFGPFRWVCTSGESKDLEKTDEIAKNVLEEVSASTESKAVKEQYEDNIRWIKEAGVHKMVVGSQARILYSDQNGRSKIAVAFNKAVQDGTLKGPVVISRDHHDVSGTDSPFRETSNIYDGSALCADMAVQNMIGDSFRGATWVSLHNGGGVGWGEVMNGGFGLVLDGTKEAEERAKCMLAWDVSNGVARRSWAGNANALETIKLTMKADPRLEVTLPNTVQNDIISKVIKNGSI